MMFSKRPWEKDDIFANFDVFEGVNVTFAWINHGFGWQCIANINRVESQRSWNAEIPLNSQLLRSTGRGEPQSAKNFVRRPIGQMKLGIGSSRCTKSVKTKGTTWPNLAIVTIFVTLDTKILAQLSKVAKGELARQILTFPVLTCWSPDDISFLLFCESPDLGQHAVLRVYLPPVSNKKYMSHGQNKRRPI